MKKIVSMVLAATISFMNVLPVQAAEINVTKVDIDPAIERQTIKGWGTSLAWWANIIGKWKDETKKNEITEMLFDKDKGIGLNVVRYNIGAGGELNPSLGVKPRIGASIESYEPSQGQWDWNADAGQRMILQKAKEAGADNFEAFSNSPPYWMTASGSPAGSLNGGNNLRDDMYSNFANYLTEVIKHFRDECGITFNTVAALNEPNSTWWRSFNNQEGCHFDRDKQNVIIKELGRQMKSKGLTTTISAPEEYSIDDTIDSYKSYDNEVKSYISSIHTHTYKGTKRTELKELGANEDKTIWNSEVTLGGSASHNHNDMTSALEQANKIRTDIVDMGSNVWCYWQAVEDEAGGHNHGLLHANFQGEEKYYITKQYYSMANYSKFIRPGFKVLEINNDKTLATYDEKTGKIVIVVTNDGSSDKAYQFDLSRYNAIGNNVEVYRTSENENFSRVPNASINYKNLRVDAKAKSITTYVISDVVYNTKQNIALNKMVYTDSEETSKGNLVSNINDGSSITRWCANDGNNNHWITVDLGKQYNLGSSEIIWESKDKSYKYKIEVSKDNKNWNEIINKSSDGFNIQRDNFQTFDTRYIKLTITQPPYKSWASINEFRVFEKDNSPKVDIINDNTIGTSFNQFNYRGSWSYYDKQSSAYMNDNHYTNKKGDSVELRFEGNRIQLYGAKDPGMGKAAVSIDGKFRGLIDYYDVQRMENILLFDSEELSAGEHVIKLECIGEYNSDSSDTYITLDTAKIFSN